MSLGGWEERTEPPVPPVHPPWTRHSRPHGCGVTAGWVLEDRGVRAGHHSGATSPLTAPTGPPARNPLLFRVRFVPSASPAPRGSGLTVSSAFIHASLQPAWRGERGAARWRRGLVPKSCPFILPGAASASPSACRDAAPCAASIAQPPAGAVLRGAFQQAARPRGWGERVWGTPPGSQPPSRPEHGGELPSKHPAVRSGSWHIPLRTSALLLLPTPCPLRLPTRPRSQPGLAAATGLALRPRAGCQHPQVLTALLLGGPAAAPLLLWPSRGLCGVLGSPGLCYPLCVPPSLQLAGSWGARRGWGVPLRGVPRGWKGQEGSGLGQGALVPLPATFPAEPWPGSRCHV